MLEGVLGDPPMRYKSLFSVATGPPNIIGSPSFSPLNSVISVAGALPLLTLAVISTELPFLLYCATSRPLLPGTKQKPC